jgi:Mce-associated membrane protein
VSAEDSTTDAETADAETTDADVADGTDDEGSNSEMPGDSRAPRSRHGLRAKVSAVLLSVALIAAAGLAGWLYVNEYRPDQETDPAAAKVALDAATSGTIALLSYSPESLDQDFAAAKSRLTGDFLSYYTQFTEQIVTPAAKEKSVKTTASVVRAAVSEIKPDAAEVLVFINQTTTSKENPDGAFAASSVKVGLTKVDGAWLIESFDPV